MFKKKDQRVVDITDSINDLNRALKVLHDDGFFVGMCSHGRHGNTSIHPERLTLGSVSKTTHEELF